MAQGKTVLQRTFECARASKTIDELFVATDDERIASHVRFFGGRVLLTSSSCINGTERITEALHNEPRLQYATAIINLQGDHPCTSPTTLDRIAELLKDPEADVSTAVRPIQTLADFHSPQVVKCVLDRRGGALYFSRSPIPYSRGEDSYSKIGSFGYHHIGIYGYKPFFLLKIKSLPNTELQRTEDLEQLKFLELGYRIKVAIVEDEALGVDTPEDLIKLEEWLCHQRLNTSLSPAELSHRLAKA